MTRSISRQEARTWVARGMVARLPPDERASLLAEWWSLDSEDEGWDELPDDIKEEIGSREEAPLDATDAKYDPLLWLAAMQKTVGVRNSWLQAKLSEMGVDPVKIVGEPEQMLECRCCGYLTLRGRRGYEICPVCFWEDDGSEELDRPSAPNHMTLREGKANFDRIGACSADALRHVVTEGQAMYRFGDSD